MLSSTLHASHSGQEPASPPSMPGNPVHAGALKRVDSGHLLSGGRELVIEHSGQEYHLRLTRNDKLILTK